MTLASAGAAFCCTGRADASGDGSTPRLAISGSASSLFVSRSPLAELLPAGWAPTLPEHVCTTVHLQSVGAESVPVTLSVVGLGESTLSTSAAGGAAQCESMAADEAALLAVPIGANSQAIRLRVPTALLPLPGTSLDGKLVVHAPGIRALEMPLKISLAGQGTFTTALLWFFGVAIPALLGLFSAQLLEWMKSRRTVRHGAWERWNAYRTANFETLNDYFRQHYPNLAREASEKFAREIDLDLRGRSWIIEIPPETRFRLLDALVHARRGRIEQLLARAFPEWQVVIKASRG